MSQLFDIISDTHFASHFTQANPSDELVKIFWNSLEPKADTLIIAGDIGEYNSQNISILQTLKKHFYKNIVLVLGNHDLYILRNQYKTSQERINEFKYMLQAIQGIHLLDGNTIEIDGIKIGGAMGWYSSEYGMKHKGYVGHNGYIPYDKKIDFQHLWLMSLRDATAILPPMEYNTFLQSERSKIEEVLLDRPDVMVTHINPSIEIAHQNPMFTKEITTSFFCYDGAKHMDSFSGKYWIFGHSHFNAEFDIDKRFKLISNCLGYGSSYGMNQPEIIGAKIKTIEI